MMSGLLEGFQASAAGLGEWSGDDRRRRRAGLRN